MNDEGTRTPTDGQKASLYYIEQDLKTGAVTLGFFRKRFTARDAEGLRFLIAVVNQLSQELSELLQSDCAEDASGDDCEAIELEESLLRVALLSGKHKRKR